MEDDRTGVFYYESFCESHKGRALDGSRLPKRVRNDASYGQRLDSCKDDASTITRWTISVAAERENGALRGAGRADNLRDCVDAV
jgi:hypothetical protein